ncbi:hypothetical protein [Subtercola boreus]|uniref:hypothetical protein n=1 Tax=Subtercola boreus TaxID=120213 RepID=UPI00114F535E|nr:hypothetical protein [Subtercola boreus]
MQMSEGAFLHLQAFEDQRFTRELELRRLARERYADGDVPFGPTFLERLAHALRLGRQQRSARRMHAARVIAERRRAAHARHPGAAANPGAAAHPGCAAHAAR